jgi:hypothetical protein
MMRGGRPKLENTKTNAESAKNYRLRRRFGLDRNCKAVMSPSSIRNLMPKWYYRHPRGRPLCGAEIVPPISRCLDGQPVGRCLIGGQCRYRSGASGGPNWSHLVGC